METPRDAPEQAFESFGVRVAIRANEVETLSRMSELAPPGARLADPSQAAQHRFSVMTDDGLHFDVRYDIRDGKEADPADPLAWVASSVDREFALALLDSFWHSCVALNAPGRVFVQAGVVAHRGRAILMPGKPLTGRTTLVAALVRAGAAPYSDDYGVLDGKGQVLPYGPAADPPLAVGAVVVTSYRPGATWSGRQVSAGAGVLAVMSHAVPAQARPQETMQAINKAIEGRPLIIESPRGEADEVAGLLLAQIDDSLNPESPAQER